MGTPTAALAELTKYLSERLDDRTWTATGGSRLKTHAGEAEAIILFVPAGRGSSKVAIEVGPRFTAVERTVSKAGRNAGLPDSYFRTASVFPTVFENIGALSSNGGSYVERYDKVQILNALRRFGLPFIDSISSMEIAADYALRHRAGHAYHDLRIPVLLAHVGRMPDAQIFAASATAPGKMYANFYTGYWRQLEPLLNARET